MLVPLQNLLANNVHLVVDGLGKRWVHFVLALTPPPAQRQALLSDMQAFLGLGLIDAVKKIDRLGSTTGFYTNSVANGLVGNMIVWIDHAETLALVRAGAALPVTLMLRAFVRLLQILRALKKPPPRKT